MSRFLEYLLDYNKYLGEDEEAFYSISVEQ